MIRIESSRECKDMSCLSYTGNVISLPETHAEATENNSVEFLGERLRLFEHDFALDVYFTFLD